MEKDTDAETAKLLLLLLFLYYYETERLARLYRQITDALNTVVSSFCALATNFSATWSICVCASANRPIPNQTKKRN